MSYFRQNVTRYSRSYSKNVTRYRNALQSSADYDDVTHTSCPSPRLWLGAQTAYTDSDWLTQLKRFTAGAFCFG